MAYTYNDREISNLDFIKRVLTIAQNFKVPLIERYRYICICCSLLDEFFEIRFSSVLEELKNTKNKTHLNKKIKKIQIYSKKLEKDIQTVFFADILPKLRLQDIILYTDNDWPESHQNGIRLFFNSKIKPYVNTIVIDINRPFPKMINKSTGYFIQLCDKETKNMLYAVVQIPRTLNRVYKLSKNIVSADKYSFVFLVAMMREHAKSLFPDHDFLNSYQFKVTRNSDLLISLEDMDDLRDSISGKLKTRQLGEPVRIETSTRMPKKIINFLADQHRIDANFIHPFRGTPSLASYINLLDHIKREDFYFPKHTPKKVSFGSDIFKWIQETDRLIHHPYESFDVVNQFVINAARDPNVISIKQTIYRADKKSKLIDALMQAAINGIDVTVVIELQARFDEEANIKWAEKLENVGAHIMYGKANFKCHAKLLVVTRRERSPKTKRFMIVNYAHLGTGNYNAKNANSYSDFSLLTSNQKITNDVLLMFDFLSGVRKNIKPKLILHSPDTHLTFLRKMINFEIREAKKNNKAELIVKVNSLTDQRAIDLLYRASNAGVKIILIVRGVSRLIPGIKKQSENISVLSTVGRFLEHHRVLYFYHAGFEHVYCSSADWMERNLSRRTEATFPILDPKLKQRVIKEALKPHIDSRHTYVLDKNLRYKMKNSKGRKLHPNEIAMEEIQ